MTTIFFQNRKRKKYYSQEKEKQKTTTNQNELETNCKVRKRLKLILMHNYVTLCSSFIEEFFFYFQIFNHPAREINPQIYHVENIIFVHHTIKHIRLWYVKFYVTLKGR